MIRVHTLKIRASGIFESCSSHLNALRSAWNRSGVKPWIWAFLILNLIVWQGAGMNPSSRFAAMRAMSESHSFRIDRYVTWTMDWAQTPDGHYYSNKAPGPALLGFPIVWVADHAAKALGIYRPMAEPILPIKVLCSVVLQAIPFALLVLLFCGYLEKRGISLAARNFTALALLFGNTAAIYMNVYFGHAMTACALMGFAYALLEKRLGWAGFSLGIALLSDYSVAMLFPPAAVAFFLASGSGGGTLAATSTALAGAVFPAILWIWYHTACFGSPFTIALKHQNPLFVYPAEHASRLWGILELHPNWNSLGQLLFGPIRGILPTQPWVFVVLFLLLVSAFRPRRPFVPTGLALFGVVSFFSLLWANAGFIEWHSGASAGPRYLSIILPVLAMMTPFLYDSASRFGRRLLWAGLGIAVTLRTLVYTRTILAPEQRGIWEFYWELVGKKHDLAAYESLAVFLLVFGVAAWMTMRPSQRPRPPCLRNLSARAPEPGLPVNPDPAA